jgi:hypothetical protein
MTKLTKQQVSGLSAIAAMGDDASDAEGYLSVCSGNWPATHAALVRRGLVAATYESDAGAWDGYGYWRYALTSTGRAALQGEHIEEAERAP